MCWCKNFARGARSFRRGGLQVWSSSLCRGGKRESGPASFVSFVEEEAEKTSQPERGIVRGKSGG